MADIRLTFSNDPKINPLLGAYSKAPDKQFSSANSPSSKLERVASDFNQVEQAASLSYEAAKNNRHLIYGADNWIDAQSIIKAKNAGKYLKTIGRRLPFINAGLSVLETGIGLEKDLSRKDGRYTETLKAGGGAAGNIFFTSLAIAGAISLGVSTAPLLLAGASAGYLGQWLGEQAGFAIGNTIWDS